MDRMTLAQQRACSEDEDGELSSGASSKSTAEDASLATPPLQSRPSFGNAKQRNSIYLPLDERNSGPALSFDFENTLQTPLAPKSPSAINPLYADPSTFPSHVPYAPYSYAPYVTSKSNTARSSARDDRINSPDHSSNFSLSFKSRPIVNFGTGSDDDTQSASTTSSNPASVDNIRLLQQQSQSPHLKQNSLNMSTSRLPFFDQPGTSTGTFLDLLPPRVLTFLDTPAAWLTYYFFANLGLTLYNKFVLVKFPFPWTMTAVHSLACTLGCLFLLQQRFFKLAKVSQRESITLVLFSTLYAMNIAVSNLSLAMASVPFHQTVRATTPIFTMCINVLLLQKTYTTPVCISLIPVILGVSFATYGEYYCTWLGFFLTLLGAVLASVKGVATNVLLVGSLRLQPLDLLLRMSPLAFIQCVIYAYATGEMDKVRHYAATEMTRTSAMSLACNGLIAFFLACFFALCHISLSAEQCRNKQNVVSFSANKKTSALTMTVAGNVKQVLTIILAVWLFSVVITPMNSIGITLTLFGGAWYARENYQLRKRKQQELSPLVSVQVAEKR